MTAPRWTMALPRVLDYLRQPDGKTSLAADATGRALNYHYDGGGRLSAEAIAQGSRRPERGAEL